MYVRFLLPANGRKCRQIKRRRPRSSRLPSSPVRDCPCPSEEGRDLCVLAYRLRTLRPAKGFDKICGITENSPFLLTPLSRVSCIYVANRDFHRTGRSKLSRQCATSGVGPGNCLRLELAARREA